jgi:hypothetical protein
MNPELRAKIQTVNEHQERDRETYRLASKIVDKLDPEAIVGTLEKLGEAKLQKILEWIKVASEPPAKPKKVKVAHSFDLVRLSSSKAIVDISPNTIRKYHDQGLQFYRQGKAVFFSKSELEEFIRRTA